MHEIGSWIRSLTFIPGCESSEDILTYYGDSMISMVWKGNPLDLPSLIFIPLVCFIFLFLLTCLVILLKFFGVIRPRYKKGFWAVFHDNFWALFYLRYSVWFFLSIGVLIYLYFQKLIKPLIEFPGTAELTTQEMLVTIVMGLVILIMALIVARIIWSVSEGYREFVAENIARWGWWGVFESFLSPIYMVIWIIMILFVTACAFLAFYPIIAVILEYVVCFLLIGFYTFYSGGGIDFLSLLHWLRILS